MLDILEERRVMATLYVDDDLAQRPSAQYTSIQAAVNAATAGDTIRVSAGTYEEAVTVDKPLTILGAQSSSDPRFRQASAARSSIVEIPAGAGFGFNLTANDIVLRGFTVEDSDDDALSPVGVQTAASASGYRIGNNIIQGNTIGISLNSDGDDETNVSRNLIRDNNQAGAAAGNGIYSDQGLSNVEIEDNRFTNQDNAAIILVGGGPLSPATAQSDVKISGNLITDGGNAAIILVNTTDGRISKNAILNHGGSAIFLGGGVSDVKIEKNLLNDGAFTGINLRTDAFGNAPVPNSNIEIEKNSITNFGDAGIRLREGANDIVVRNNNLQRNGDGISLEDADNNLIEKNEVSRNTRDGIRLDALSVDNVLSKNSARSNIEHDYHDDSIGTGTAGTANTWSKNKGRTQNRPGLIA